MATYLDDLTGLLNKTKLDLVEIDRQIAAQGDQQEYTAGGETTKLIPRNTLYAEKARLEKRQVELMQEIRKEQANPQQQFAQSFRIYVR